MKRSCAFASLIVCLAPAAPAGAAAGEAPEPAPDAGTAGDAGPEEAPGARVLVLPTRAQVGAGVDAGAIDVLVAAAFQELGFEVVDARSVLAERCGSGGAPLVRARESYLDMDLEGALDIARSVQEEQLENRCDLLADPILEEADLFTVQILLDLGRKSEAYDLAERILVRHPNLRLDPVEFSPSMQALWAGAVKRMTGKAPNEGRAAS